MSSGRMIDIDDAEAVNEVLHWVVITAVHDLRLLGAKGKFARELAENDDVKKLQQLGCDKNELLDTLAFAKAMPGLYPPLDANALRNLARDLARMLKRMRRITPSILLPIAEERGGRVNMVPTGGDLHIWPELESELQRKANGYEQLARLCRLRKIPSRATFRKFAFVWPVQDINSCTGHPHYAAASRLLSYAGIDKNEKQLKVAFHSALEHYPSVLSWMGRATSFLHETAGFI